MLFLFLLVWGTSLPAQLVGTWRVERYFSLEIDPRTGVLDAREVAAPARQFLRLNGREMLLPALSSERIPYVRTSNLSFLFRLEDRQYRAVLLDDLLYIQILGAGGSSRSDGPGYLVFYLESSSDR